MQMFKSSLPFYKQFFCTSRLGAAHCIKCAAVFFVGFDFSYYIYNVCDHQECYHEVGSQAISYTTGVPAMIGSMMVVTGQWKKPGVFNVEEFDPDPYMEALNKWGLPWKVCEDPELVKVWKANED